MHMMCWVNAHNLIYSVFAGGFACEKGERCWKSEPANHVRAIKQQRAYGGTKGKCFFVGQVCYYRYLRFVPDGRFLYRTSPQPLREVARSLLRPAPSRARSADEVVQRGRFLLKVRPGFAVSTAVGVPVRRLSLLLA